MNPDVVSSKAILLINLGTPDAPTFAAVYRYLKEFLLDPRVIDYPAWKRHLLVRGLIIPRRLKSSTISYQKIWKKEGSPLLYYGEKIKALLEQRLKGEYKVTLCMRYQNPSIKSALNDLFSKNSIEELIVLPLFPQYAS